MEKKFDAIINDLNKEIDLCQQHREKLYELIIKIFYEDPPIIGEPPIRLSNPDGYTVEMRLKQSIGKIKIINKEFAQCLQIMSGWV